MGTIGGEELLKWEKMQTRASNLEEKILVLVRLRPLSEREIARDEVVDWECINGNTILYRNSLRERSGFPTAYTYDRVFGGDCSTRQLYDEGAKEIALSVVSGINSTIFAYGQTSSGKTYTMIGLTENTVADIYAYMHRHEERAFVLKFSAMEIYNEVVRDLLSNDSSPLRILDDQEKGTIVEKLTEEKLRDWNHLKQLLSICEAQRQTGETSLNEKSSRSHQILRLTIESSACEFLGKDKSTTLSACVNFVDLAGSERASQALSVGARLKEGCHINRSLLTLGTVIRKLSNGKHGHINYRDSKLTRILQPSLGGNARTAIVCTLCPARSHVEQSRNTLLFASCAKEVTTNAQVNVVMSDKTLVKHLQKEVARLESELRSPAPTTSTCDYGTLLRKKDLQIERMEKEIRELTKQRDLAQSRVQDLLQVIENDQASRQWVGGEDESTSPGVVNSNFLDVNTQKFCKINYYDNGHVDPYQDHPDSSDDCSVSDDMSPYQNGHMEEIAIGNREDPDDLYKDVQCVEMEQSSKDQNFESPALSSGENEGLAVAASRNVGITDWRVISTPLSRDRDISTCNGSMKLTRSWSCGDNGRVQFCDSERGVPGTLEDMQRRSPLAMYGINAGRLLGNESQAHIRKSFVDKLKELDIENSTYDDITSIHTFVAGLKEMAELQFGKQPNDDQVQEAGPSVVGSGTNPKDVGLDWPLEFERQRWAIIELWQTCNVSLVHRTYFFLLFSGDPSDSIYMEVELRRLSFLKEQFFQGNHAVRDGRTQTLKFSSSVKTLCRERRTLCKLMRKRFSKREREKLYKEWGVNLELRRRHLRLTNRLWSDTKDLDHITKSARIVARLVKFSEKEKDLKEMFGLSFTPPPPARKSLVGGLLHGLSSSPRRGGI